MYVNRFRHVWFQGWVLGHGTNFGLIQSYADVDRVQNFLYVLADVLSKTCIFYFLVLIRLLVCFHVLTEAHALCKYVTH
jgi:hypothetical protein